MQCHTTVCLPRLLLGVYLILLAQGRHHHTLLVAFLPLSCLGLGEARGKTNRTNRQQGEEHTHIGTMCPCFLAPSALPFLRGRRACMEAALMLAIGACGCRLTIPSRASAAATQYHNIVQIYGSHIKTRGRLCANRTRKFAG